MKLGSQVWVHLNDEFLLNRVMVLLSGTLVGETSETVTIAGGGYIFVISWEKVLCLERREEDNVVC